MVKMEIQDFEMIKGITGIKIRKIFKIKDKEEKISEELINIGKGK